MRALHVPVAIALAGVWGALLGFGHGLGDNQFLDRIEATVTDLRTLARGAKAPPDLVTIVAIDDQTAREKGYPLPRAALAEVIERIAQFKPKAVAIDLLLVDPGLPDGDAALAHALGSTKTVLAAAAVFDTSKEKVAAKDDVPLAQLPTAARLLLPLKVFADQAAVGVVNLTTDRTGIPRSIPLLLRTNDALMVSLPLRVASVASGEDPRIAPDNFLLAGKDVPTDIGHQLPLSFYGPRGSIRTISAATVLDGRLARADIENRVVAIGVTVPGGGDFFPTPFDPVVPGVEVIATGITHLLAKDGLVRNRSVRLADYAIAIVLPMLLVGLLAWRRNLIGLIAVASVVAIWTLANFAAFTHGIWMSAALPIAAAAPPTLLFGAVQIWISRRNAQHFAATSDRLQLFQAPALRETLLNRPDFLLKPVYQNAAIVFIDLARFTALSESLQPNALRLLLRAFHSLIDHEAVACGGVITSFMGDGAMILFGLPEATDADAANAARCCIGLCARTEQWMATLPPALAAQTGFKIGAHYGEIVASRLGGGSHQHITAIGDAVNVASRLMEVAASNNVAVAVSDEMLRKSGPDCALLTSGVLTGPRDTELRGRSGAMSVWLWKSAAGGEA